MAEYGGVSVCACVWGWGKYLLVPGAREGVGGGPLLAAPLALPGPRNPLALLDLALLRQQ